MDTRRLSKEHLMRSLIMLLFYLIPGIVGLIAIFGLNSQLIAKNAQSGSTWFVAFLIVWLIGLGLMIVSLLACYRKTKRALQKVVAETGQMAIEIGAGNLAYRAQAGNVDAEYSDILDDFNRVVESYREPLVIMRDHIEQIATGQVPPKIEKVYQGEMDLMRLSINKAITTTENLLSEARLLIIAIKAGKLDVRGDWSKFENRWAKLIYGINEVVENFVAPIQITSEKILAISKGIIPPKVEKQFEGDFNILITSINTAIDGLQALTGANRILQKVAINDLSEKASVNYPGHLLRHFSCREFRYRQPLQGSGCRGQDIQRRHAESRRLHEAA